MLPILLSLSLPAAAHMPYFCEGGCATPEAAWPVEDIETSIVVYAPVTCDAPELWLEFEADAGDELYFQLGVPVLDRLEDYRPTVALLAPGLPAIDLPFDVPEGLGGVVFDTADVQVPDEFHEPFSNTDSWVLVETTEVLPEGGTGYLVAWDPSGQTGKLWLAVGTVEDFAGVNWSEAATWLAEVQGFHETGDDAPESPIEEALCDVDTGTGSGAEATDGGERGCATGDGGGLGWLSLLPLAAILRRRVSGAT